MKITIPNSLQQAYQDTKGSLVHSESLPEINNFQRSHLDALSQAVFKNISYLKRSLKGSPEPGSEDWEEEEDQNAVLFLRDCLRDAKRLQGWIEDIRRVTDPIHY